MKNEKFKSRKISKMLKSDNNIDAVFGYISSLALKKKYGQTFSLDFYEQLKKNSDRPELIELIKNSATSGYCFFYAIALSLAVKGSVLMQGILHKLDVNRFDEYYEEFVHSWVEIGDKVYDTTKKQVFDKNFYYEKFDVEVKRSVIHEKLLNEHNFFSLLNIAVTYRDDLLNGKIDYILSQDEKGRFYKFLMDNGITHMSDEIDIK